MIEVRIHGRGGQGAVIGCDMMAVALLKDGKYSQSFPFYGGERRGAPVQAFLRIDDKPVLARNQVYTPDQVVVLDATLLSILKPTLGLKPGGLLLINSERDPDSFEFSGQFKVATVDATAIAAKHNLGTRQSRPVNTAILGAYVRVSGVCSLSSLLESVREQVPAKIEENIAAARDAYEQVKVGAAVKA